MFRFGYFPRRLTRLDGGAECGPENVAGNAVSLVCAIARPDGFAKSVKMMGARIDRRFIRPDHDPYDDATLASLDRLLDHSDPGRLEWLTTEKDAVKLRSRLSRPQRLWVLEMDLLPEPEWETFFTGFLQRVASRR